MSLGLLQADGDVRIRVGAGDGVRGRVIVGVGRADGVSLLVASALLSSNSKTTDSRNEMNNRMMSITSCKLLMGHKCHRTETKFCANSMYSSH